MYFFIFDFTRFVWTLQGPLDPYRNFVEWVTVN